MDFTQHGPADGPDLVWVLGWGNQHDHTNVEWLTEQLVDEGYCVHVATIPTVIDDFEAQYVAPVAAYVDDLDSFRLLSHSAGGLIAAYIDGAETTTFLSPFWGFQEGQLDLDKPLIDLGSLLPLSKPIFPSGTASREAMGELATDRELEAGPSRAAPSWLRECRTAHKNLPPIPDEAVVFCTLTEPVVSLKAIGKAVPSERVILYDGGHELFSSRSREDHLDTLLAVIDGGAAALS